MKHRYDGIVELMLHRKDLSELENLQYTEVTSKATNEQKQLVQFIDSVEQAINNKNSIFYKNFNKISSIIEKNENGFKLTKKETVILADLENHETELTIPFVDNAISLLDLSAILTVNETFRDIYIDFALRLFSIAYLTKMEVPYILLNEILISKIEELEYEYTQRKINQIQKSVLERNDTSPAIHVINDIEYRNKNMIESYRMNGFAAPIHLNEMHLFLKRTLEYLKTKHQFSPIKRVNSAQQKENPVSPDGDLFFSLFEPKYAQHSDKFIGILAEMGFLTANLRWNSDNEKAIAKVFWEELRANDVVKNTVKDTEAGRAFSSKFSIPMSNMFAKPVGAFSNIHRDELSRKIVKLLNQISK